MTTINPAAIAHIAREGFAAYWTFAKYLYEIHMAGDGRPSVSPYPFESLSASVQVNWCKVAKGAESWVMQSGEWARLPTVENGGGGE